MSLFMIETDDVANTATNLSSIAKKVEATAEAVRGYDTSCEEDFDFSSPRALIASNIEACMTKIQNSSQLATAVVEAHTSLQNSMQYTSTIQESRATSSAENASLSENSSPSTTPREEASTTKEKEESTPNEITPPTALSPTAASITNNGSPSTVGNSTTITPKTTVIPRNSLTSTDAKLPEGTIGATTGLAVSAGLTKEEVLIPGQQEKKEEEIERVESTPREQEIHPTIEKIQCSFVKDFTKLKEETKKIFTSPQFSYNDHGYATYDNKYIISCDKSLGNIGEEITFVKKDGTKVECVIGNTTESEKNQKIISFVVDNEKWQVAREQDEVLGLLENIDKIIKKEKVGEE